MTTIDTTSTRGAPPGGSTQQGEAAATAAAAPVEEGDGFPADDRGLLDLAVASLVTQNRAHAARLEAVSRFHANRVAEAQAARSSGRPSSGSRGFFVLTPAQATRAELAPLLGIAEHLVAADLEVTDGLKKWFPRLWARCLAGRLDLGRARLAYAQLANLTCVADKKAYAALVEDYFDRLDDPTDPVCAIGWRRFAAAVRRRCLKFPQRDEQDSYAEAFKKRRVSVRTDDNGMTWLTASASTPDALAADYRLTLIAKKLRENHDETRTLDQLRADTLIDLIHGRLTVAATTGALEHDNDGPDSRGSGDAGAGIARHDSVGGYARPVINVTVPVTTLMGLEDTPGVMAGDLSVPADLVRRLALHPEATWYRLLTDPAGGFLELSVDRYTPTEPIYRWTTARDRTCIWPGCTRPASICELDHRLAYPLGATSTSNLQPLCRRHHQVKHSDGFTLTRNDDGAYTWNTRFGSTFHTPAPDYPASVWPDPGEQADLEIGSVIERQFREWLESAAVRR